MGEYRDTQIHRCFCRLFECHRGRLQLDRVPVYQKCRPFPVGLELDSVLVLILFQSYGMQYHGQMALQIAILVAFTQLIPEHQVQLFGVLKARVKVPLPVYTSFMVSLVVRRRCQWPT